jgi:transposase
VTVQDADQGDTTTSRDTLIDAAEQVEAVRPDGAGIEEVVGDKGCHSNQSLVDLEALGIRSFISEPDRGRRNWKKNPTAQRGLPQSSAHPRSTRPAPAAAARRALRTTLAYLYETGGMRRVHLRGHTNILKRLLIHCGAFNLGLLMRQLIGVGTPRGLQGRRIAAMAALLVLTCSLWQSVRCHRCPTRRVSTLKRRPIARYLIACSGVRETAFTAGC